MKRKLDTRFPAARIKKIMQADEDVGKIAMAVPLLVSKALELFLQDLCDRTYEITLMKGAKTLNSSHLKLCVQGFNVFDFLREIVGQVPDLGGLDAGGEDCHVPKKRKVDADDESSKSSMPETCHVTSCGRRRGRGRGRGKGQGRGIQTLRRETPAYCGKYEDDTDISHFEEHNLSRDRRMPDDVVEHDELKKHSPASDNIEAPVRNFDLNAELDENGDSIPSIAGGGPRIDYIPQNKEEYPGWSLSEIEKMDIDPIELANSTRGIDDEDYDEEGVSD